ncbi:hypothetical protein CAPTEDRAFT_216035 [Capitella teleta]|uniref:G-protein coupled receptors family 1 profile domain-containing protein n=1 Tax=Capitella teleta TaxID=283909 RepID=R7TRG5_CAPTE|nr:hypothetical protein CAPTEDRAFT_216035 [Capitella teleta]|eukprot:ELT96503.1 hypothetical protein CAPTEDRAFT_216035 [Capitella teleta]
MARLPFILLAALVVTVATQTEVKDYLDDHTVDPVINKELEITKNFVRNRKAAMYNYQIASTCLCPMNYLLNGLSIVVFLKMAPKQKQAALLVMIGLCFADAAATTYHIDYVIWANFGWSLMQNTDWGCKFFNWLGVVGSDCSYVFCLLIALERFASVMFPLKVSLWFTKRRVKIAMVAVILIFSSLEMNRFWFFRKALINNVNFCYRSAETSKLSRQLSLGINRILGFLIPWVFICLLNLGIVIRLKQLNMQHQKLGKTDSSHQNNHSLTLMFLSMSIFSLLSRAFDTYNVIHILVIGSNYINDYSKYIISTCLILSGHSLNFVFYTLAGSKFRKTSMEMVCFCKRSTGGPRTFTQRNVEERPPKNPSMNSRHVNNIDISTISQN